MTARRLTWRAQAAGWTAPALLAGACAFEPGGPTAGGGGEDAGPAAVPDGGGANPACPEPLHLELSVGGRIAADTPGQPFVTVLLGDTVRLSAAGSCSQVGGLRHEWQLGGGLVARAGDLAAESLDVYPGATGDHSLTLRLTDDAGSQSVSIPAIRALGWTRAAAGLDVLDVAVGGGRVWVASTGGAEVLELADPGAGARPINTLAAGADVPNDLSAVHFSDGLVWFGHKAGDDEVWRLTVSTLTVAAVSFAGQLSSTEVRDINSQGTGIAVATKNGVLFAPDNQNFDAALAIGDTFAVVQNQAGGWAGGERLHRLADLERFDPFEQSNNKIRALASDGDRLWIGSDDRGVARLDVSSESGAVVYDERDGLPSDRIRGLAVEASGDVWAACGDGVARYKHEWDAWLAMGDAAGLDGLTDVRGIAVLESDGQRSIVIGSRGGIGILGSP